MVTIWMILCLWTSFVLSENKSDEGTELLFVHILFRHGDRSPEMLYPNDPNNSTFWPEGLGKLTKLGRQQHYALGKFLRSMYANFSTSNPNEVVVNSTAVDRCMRSAESNMASFYAPGKEWTFEENLNWQPIPIFYSPLEIDKYLYHASQCPKAFEEQKKVYMSSEWKSFLKKHKEMLANLTLLSGFPALEGLTAYLFYDTLYIEKKYNLIIPPWVGPYWDELTCLAKAIFKQAQNSTLLHRLRAGPLLGKIIENMNKKISGKLPHQKIQVYSAHDSNIEVVSQALKVPLAELPPYCATMLFELHQRKNGQKVVRLLLLNSTQPEDEIQMPHVLLLEGCYEFCPLEYFINYTKHLIPEDWEQECKLNQSNHRSNAEYTTPED